jgi:hypothetical protein
MARFRGSLPFFKDKPTAAMNSLLPDIGLDEIGAEETQDEQISHAQWLREIAGVCEQTAQGNLDLGCYITRNLPRWVAP